MEDKIYKDLVEKANYALNSHSLVLVYETYGAAKMAYQLNAITYEQFLELNSKLVKNGVNNPKANLE